MSRKVYVNVTTRLIIHADEGTDIENVLENMDYSFTSNNSNANIEETEITDWEITNPNSHQTSWIAGIQCSSPNNDGAGYCYPSIKTHTILSV